MTAPIEPEFVTVPHEPSADARRAAVLEDRIAAAGGLILTALTAQVHGPVGERNWPLLNLIWDLQAALCLRAPGAPEPPVVPGRSS
jgi:hypothetical protein